MGAEDFSEITDALLQGGRRRRRSYRGGAGRRGSKIAAALKAQGVPAGPAEALGAKIDEAASMKELETAAAQGENKEVLVKSVAETSKALKTVLNDELNKVADAVAAAWAGLTIAAGPAATGAVVATGAIGVAAWRSEYVRMAMKEVMPIIIADLKAAAKENVGAALSISALLSAALVIFLMLFFNRLTRELKVPGAPSAELTVIEAENQGVAAVEASVAPSVSEQQKKIEAAIERARAAAAKAVAAEAAGNEVPKWTGANAIPLALTNGGRRRSTSRRRRRAAYLPRQTRRSSSGRRRGYSRRQRE
jgi:hypothetical protein